MSLFSGIHSIHQLSNARSRSISPENFTGEKGRGGLATEGTGKSAARDLGRLVERLLYRRQVLLDQMAVGRPTGQGG